MSMKLTLSGNTLVKLKKLAYDNALDTAEVVERGIALMGIALAAEVAGNHLVVADEHGNVVTSIVGIRSLSLN
jgi:hypothetical protein